MCIYIYECTCIGVFSLSWAACGRTEQFPHAPGCSWFRDPAICQTCSGSARKSSFSRFQWPLGWISFPFTLNKKTTSCPKPYMSFSIFLEAVRLRGLAGANTRGEMLSLLLLAAVGFRGLGVD